MAKLGKFSSKLSEPTRSKSPLGMGNGGYDNREVMMGSKGFMAKDVIKMGPRGTATGRKLPVKTDG